MTKEKQIKHFRERVWVSTIGFYRTKSVWGWGNLERFSTWINIQFLLSYQMESFNKRTRNWKLRTKGRGYIHFPWWQCSTFSWNSAEHQNHVSSLDFSSLSLFTQFSSGIHSDKARIKAAFTATITTNPKNRCAINVFVGLYSSQEHGHRCGSAGVRKKVFKVYLTIIRQRRSEVIQKSKNVIVEFWD